MEYEIEMVVTLNGMCKSINPGLKRLSFFFLLFLREKKHQPTK